MLAQAEEEQREARIVWAAALRSLAVGLQTAHTARRCAFAEVAARAAAAAAEGCCSALAVCDAAAMRGEAVLAATASERAAAASAEGEACERRPGWASGGEAGEEMDGPGSARLPQVRRCRSWRLCSLTLPPTRFVA